jgi:hypothetical protein
VNVRGLFLGLLAAAGLAVLAAAHPVTAPAGGNYHIGPTSAARDAGVAAGIHTDIDGDPRPFGAGYDIGADESLTPFWIYLPLVFR